MQVLEGTWEEVKEHDQELAGKKVTLIVQEPKASDEQNGDYKPGRFDKYFGVISNGELQGRNAEADFGRIVEENYRREKARRHGPPAC